MRKYLLYGSYTTEGYQDLLEEGGSVRIPIAKRALKSVGGKLESFYYANGGQDFYIVVDLPDHLSAAAITLVGNAGGAFRIRAEALLTPAEMDAVVSKEIDFNTSGN